ncbi:MAG: NAD(P)H-dependent oxidoreductase [Bacteroidales bacterium]|jgi:chromate reductase|nr:NAD(P)H-dependent oxidoreductase [Bacteroidales bacterium]
MKQNIIIVALCGSLRKESYNKKLIQLAQTLAPKGMIINEIDFSVLPYYNEDLDMPDSLPAAVADFQKQLAEADGLLIVSPEYNYALPGGLKNALDWASRSKSNMLFRKPVSLWGASIGAWGTTRMQSAMLTFFHLYEMPFVKPDVLVSAVHTKFNDRGEFADPQTLSFIEQNLQNLKNAGAITVNCKL